MSSDDLQNQSGLVITVTDSTRSFLLSASNDLCLSQELRECARTLCSQTNVPYRLIRNIWLETDADTRPGMTTLFSKSNFVFSSPKPRKKNKELKERLRKLQEIVERREYQELVRDITPKKDFNEPFSTYKDQLGFGLHIALMMFTGYLVGYFAFKALFDRSPIMNVAGGIFGLVFGMLVETLLFIIRTSEYERKSSSSSSSRLKKNQ